MELSVPILTDERGIRWASVGARAYRRRFPDHRTWLLRAEPLAFPKASPVEVLRFIQFHATLESDRLPLFFLKGDEYHPTEFYDITSHIGRCLESGDEREKHDIAGRLAGRYALRVLTERGRLPNWWTESLAEGFASLAEETDADGILLESDWLPAFDTNAPVYAWSDEAFEPSEFPVVLPWLFEVGEPSVRARMRALQALSESAAENLARCAQAFERKRLGVAFPLTWQRAWMFSPYLLSRRGIVPFLTALSAAKEELSQGASLLRLAETSLTVTPTLRPRFSARRGSEASTGFLNGWGFLLTDGDASRPPLPDDATLRPRLLLIHPRDDAWAHSFDEQTPYFAHARSRLAEWLTERGIPFGVADEACLEEVIGRIQPRLVLLAPCRSVRVETVRVLGEWMGTRRTVVVVEPLPYLADGRASSELESFLTRPRLRRLDLEGRALDKTLTALLRKTGIAPEIGVYARATGLPLQTLRRQALDSTEGHYSVFFHAESEPLLVLVELPGEVSVQRWDGSAWRETSFWHANGNTYLELPAEPERLYFLRSVSAFF
jgi:hypothetical protein